jgi:class 3 adenylate cyclase
VLGPGTQVLDLSNDTDRLLVVRVERAAPRDDALTAARASSLAVFRELFPLEVLSPGCLVSVSEVTLLLTDLNRGPRSLYQELGDARAFAVLHEQFQRIDGEVRAAGGAVVKTVGEGLMAAFTEPDWAVRAGLAIPPALAASDTTRELVPRLRIAAHRGPVMAATLNDHLDYFGNTVHEAFETLELTRPGSFVLSRPVASEASVAARLATLGDTTAVLPETAPGLPFGPFVWLRNAGRNGPLARAEPERVGAPSGDGNATLLLPPH